MGLSFCLSRGLSLRPTGSLANGLTLYQPNRLASFKILPLMAFNQGGAYWRWWYMRYRPNVRVRVTLCRAAKAP
jgi:hypothetical protein